MSKIYDVEMSQVENPNEFQRYLRDNPCYWNRNGKYQAAVEKIQALIPASGEATDPHVEDMRITINGYYDYFNNGGYNTDSLKPMCDRLVFTKGSSGAKALSKLKRYNTDSLNYLPDNLEKLYDTIIDQLVEDLFPNYIEGI